MVGATVLTVSTEPDAIDLQAQIWVKILRDLVNAQNPAKLGDIFYDDLTGISDETVAQMRYCGHLKNAVMTDNGTTICWSVVMKVWQVEKYYIFKPADQYLIGLTGYDIEIVPIEWIPPEYRG
jgi:hypothetical protein